MEFGLSKCAMLVIKKGKMMQSEGIAMPDGQKMRCLGTDRSY